MKKIIALLLAVLLIGTFFVGCGTTTTTDTATSNDAAQDDLAYVKNNGKLIIGITEFEPMDYQDADGSWIGFDADMANNFAESLGVKAEFVVIDWDSKVMELDSKKVDCIWNGMTLTEDVKEAMSTSKPYCNNAQVVVVNKDVADKYQKVEDCKELNFAVESGSAGQEQAEANGLKYTEVESQATALMEVSSGKCDAAIIDSLMAAAMIGEGTSFDQLTYTCGLNSEEYGVGFRKGSNITEEYNKWFDACLADGSVAKIAEQYGVQAALVK